MSQSLNQKPSKIFISYRRNLQGADGRLLYDKLKLHFGEDQVFIDVDHIYGGDHFVQVIENAVRSCQILIALIGKGWLSSIKRRANKPNDFMRQEIAAALRLEEVCVIPVLVQEATMPAMEDLPEDLKQLVYLHNHELSYRYWDRDVESLIEDLQKTLEKQQRRKERKQRAEEDRIRQEEEALRLAEEEQRRVEEQKLQAEAEARRLAEEETARKRAEEEEARRLLAEQEARRAEEARLKAEQEDARLRAEEKARRLAEEERRREAELKRKQIEEDERRRREQPQQRQDEDEHTIVTPGPPKTGGVAVALATAEPLQTPASQPNVRARLTGLLKKVEVKQEHAPSAAHTSQSTHQALLSLASNRWVIIGAIGMLVVIWIIVLVISKDTDPTPVPLSANSTPSVNGAPSPSTVTNNNQASNSQASNSAPGIQANTQPNPPIQQSAAYYYNLGNEFYKRAENGPDDWFKEDLYGAAAANYRQAIKREQNNAQYHNTLGDCLRALGRFSEAEVEFGLAVKNEPENDAYHSDWGDILYKLGTARYTPKKDRKDLLIKAEQHFLDALDKLENKKQGRSAIGALYRFYLGNTLKKLGKRADADTQYSKALTLIEKGTNNDLRTRIETARNSP